MSEEQNSPTNAAAPDFSQVVLLDWLRTVEDPELFMSLVDLGLIYSVTVENGIGHVEMTLTSPGCPSAGYLVDQVKDRLKQYPGISDAEVMIVFEPKWDPSTMASDEVKDRLGIW